VPRRRRPVSPQRALDVVGHLYEAVLAPEHWAGAMAVLAETLDAHRAVLFTPGASADRMFWTAHDFDPSMLVGYAEHYHAHDLWTHRGMAGGAPTGWCNTGEHLVPEAEFRASEFWNDFLRPMDMFRLATVVVDGGAATLPRTHLSVFGPARRDPFDAEATGFLALVAPHVRRTLLLRQALMRGADVAPALGQATAPLIACSASGRVLLANDAAVALLADADGLATQAGVLVCAEARESRELRRLVGGAAAPGGDARRVAGVLRVSRPSGARSMTLIVAPIPRGRRPVVAGVEATALVLVHRADAPLGAAAEVLRSGFSLTAAELRLVASLLDGGSLSHAARKQRLSHATLRSQLKSVFEKTGTHRQSELVSLVHALRQLAPAS
jgi:DNA-binding CsgD family transcriptional regulator